MTTTPEWDSSCGFQFFKKKKILLVSNFFSMIGCFFGGGCADLKKLSGPMRREPKRPGLFFKKLF